MHEKYMRDESCGSLQQNLLRPSYKWNTVSILKFTSQKQKENFVSLHCHFRLFLFKWENRTQELKQPLTYECMLSDVQIWNIIPHLPKYFENTNIFKITLNTDFWD